MDAVPSLGCLLRPLLVGFWHHQGMQGRSLCGVSVALSVAAPCLALLSFPSVSSRPPEGGNHRGTEAAKGKGVPSVVVAPGLYQYPWNDPYTTDCSTFVFPFPPLPFPALRMPFRPWLSVAALCWFCLAFLSFPSVSSRPPEGQRLCALCWLGSGIIRGCKGVPSRPWVVCCRFLPYGCRSVRGF